MVSEGVFKIDELIHKIKPIFGMVTLIGIREDMIINYGIVAKFSF